MWLSARALQRLPRPHRRPDLPQRRAIAGRRRAQPVADQRVGRAAGRGTGSTARRDARRGTACSRRGSAPMRWCRWCASSPACRRLRGQAECSARQIEPQHRLAQQRRNDPVPQQQRAAGRDRSDQRRGIDRQHDARFQDHAAAHAIGARRRLSRDAAGAREECRGNAEHQIGQPGHVPDQSGPTVAGFEVASSGSSRSCVKR